MEAKFDEERILGELSRLEPHQQLAFGASCCERMLPNYETFVREVGWRDARPLRNALDAAWDACASECLPEAGLREMLSRCEERVPDSENFTSLYTSSAQDAAFAICHLLEFMLDGGIARIACIPRLSTDSVDLIVQEREAMDPRDPLRESMILEHPLMQQELVRQRRDLEDASRISRNDRGAVVALRTRARDEPNLAIVV